MSVRMKKMILKKQIEKAEEIIDSLIKHLHRKDYDKAAKHLENSKKPCLDMQDVG